MSHPSLTVICDWPANAADITPELARTLCHGNVKLALEDIAALVLSPVAASAAVGETRAAS